MIWEKCAKPIIIAALMMRTLRPARKTCFAAIALLSLIAAGCSKRNAIITKSAAHPVSALAGGAFTRPVLAQAENETLYVLAADAPNQKLVLAMSHDGGDSFMPTVAVNPAGAPGAVPQREWPYIVWRAG